MGRGAFNPLKAAARNIDGRQVPFFGGNAYQLAVDLPGVKKEAKLRKRAMTTAC